VFPEIDSRSSRRGLGPNIAITIRRVRRGRPGVARRVRFLLEREVSVRG
jgi:hypothetical protein